MASSSRINANNAGAMPHLAANNPPLHVNREAMGAPFVNHQQKAMPPTGVFERMFTEKKNLTWQELEFFKTTFSVASVKRLCAIAPAFSQLPQLDNLTYLDLSNSTITNAELLEIIARSPNLKTINLDGCRTITPEIYNDLVKAKEQMTYQDLELFKRVVSLVAPSPSPFSKLPMLHYLKSLDLSESKVTDKELKELLLHSPNLTSLNISHCRELTENVSTAFGPHSKNLTSLNLSRINISELGFRDLFAALTNNINHINLANCGITDAALRVLAVYCPKLHMIDLENNSMTERGILSLVQQCKELTSLTLKYCTQIKDSDVKVITTHCLKLESIDLSNCSSITDEALIAIGERSSHLKSIQLKGCTNITDNGLKKFAELRKRTLTSLDLSNCTSLTPAGIVTLFCPELCSIDLSYCKVTDQAMETIVDLCGKLTSITLNNCRLLSDRTLKCLERNARLLHFSSKDGGKFTSRAIVDFANKNPMLTRIDVVVQGGFSSSAVERVAESCPHLQTFSINGEHSITPHSIRELVKRCSQIQMIYIGDLHHNSLHQFQTLKNEFEHITIEFLTKAIEYT